MRIYMITLRPFIFFICGWLITHPASAAAIVFENPIYKFYTVKGTFEDVKIDVRTAIINQGLVVDYRANIGRMVERTGKVVAGKNAKKLYLHAEFYTFCSAKLSRQAMELDPLNIAFCPYVIYVFERADQKGVIYVGYRRYTTLGPSMSQVALDDINALLDKIAREATE